MQSHQNDLGAGAHDTKGNAERTQPLFSPEKTKLRKKLVSTCLYVTCWDDTCWDGVRFFFKVHGVMTKGKGHTLKHITFPREVMESLSSETLKSRQRRLEHCCLMRPALSTVLDYMTARGSFLPKL